MKYLNVVVIIFTKEVLTRRTTPRDLRNLKLYAGKHVLLKKAKSQIRRLASVGVLMKAAREIERLMYRWRPTFRQTRRTMGELIRTPLPAKAVRECWSAHQHGPRSLQHFLVVVVLSYLLLVLRSELCEKMFIFPVPPR